MSTISRLDVALLLVRKAGEIAAAAFADVNLVVEAKGPGDLVSAADYAIERLAIEVIGNAFPEDGFVGEEFGGTVNDRGFTWLIDPIDGTVNFARKLGYYCVSLALLQDGSPIAAWILDPERDELFHAGPDRLVRLNELPVRCAPTDNLTDAVVGVGFSLRHDQGMRASIVNALTEAGAEHRRLGAGALCLAHVAAGRLDAYLEPHMNPWDAVGGLYLAACAGAVTSDYLALGGLEAGAAVLAIAPGISVQLLASLPAPLSGTPLHRQNEQRSAGELRVDRKPSPTVETQR